MTTRIIISMWLTLAFSVNAGEPLVQENTLPDGLTELRVVSAAVIQEGWDRIRKFSVQYKVGDEWKNAAEGTSIGDDGLEMDFAPVKARVFRLNITESTDAPTIWEFQLFGEDSPRKKTRK